MALLKILNSARLTVARTSQPNLNAFNILKRCCHWNMTEVIPKDEQLPKYEELRDEKLWQYVERLLPQTEIPPVPVKKYYPSGWKPQKLHENMPYFVQRTRNHMLPVYLRTSHRGQKRVTWITKVHGDIHKLAEDLHKFLVKVYDGKRVGIKVVEVCGRIDIHGDHVSNVKLWLERRNY